MAAWRLADAVTVRIVVALPSRLTVVCMAASACWAAGLQREMGSVCGALSTGIVFAGGGAGVWGRKATTAQQEG